MADFLKLFQYNLHQELEALERELVEVIKQRVVKEGEDFPGEASVLQATVEVDLNAVLRSSSSTRSLRQVQQAKGEEGNQSTEVPRDQEEGKEEK